LGTATIEEFSLTAGVAPVMKRVLRVVLWVLLVLVTAAAIAVRLSYGGGRPYNDVTGRPILPDDRLETVLSYPEPIGNVAVSDDGRGFFTVHPESRPRGAKLLEFSDGEAWPYPSEAVQDDFFQTPLGVVVDRRQRLWIIDHGRHGFGAPRLIAFEMATGRVVHDHHFDRAAAPRGSFLQDLQVSPDGKTVYIADLSFWRKRPAIVVHDIATATDRRVLESHPSVTAQDWLITTRARQMVFFGGLAAMKPGIDGIAIGADGRWLAYGAMSHDTLYRVPTAALRNRSLGEEAVAAQVEALGRKPLSDGLSADLEGGIWITDVEHGAVLRMSPDGALETWVETPRIRWADALSFGPDGWLYLADSAIPDHIMRSKKHIVSQAPYFIFRFNPGIAGVPGQ
jgi:sugar lactone lactonase YvrE